MPDPNHLSATSTHLQAAAQHYLSVQKMHVGAEVHKALKQTHLAHGPKLNSASHHDHAALQHASCRVEHHPE